MLIIEIDFFHILMNDTLTYINGCFIRTDLLRFLSYHNLSSFQQIMNYAHGKSITRKRGRTVVRVNLGSRSFYLKRNRIEVHEFFKALRRLRVNYSGARQENRAIATLNNLGIETVPLAAYGERRILGVEFESFLMTEELYDYESLEKIAQLQWEPRLRGERLSEKRLLIAKAAECARRLHTSGAYHQDFYLGHFFIHPKKPVALIDVQRLVKREKVPERYYIKDLAQLYYSARITDNISRSDCLRFFLIYRQKERLDKNDRRLIKKIGAKVQKIGKHTEKLLARRRKRGEIQ
jgi:heptose I phosphotransferase